MKLHFRKNLHLLLCLVLAVSLQTSIEEVNAEESPLSVDLSTGLYSDYMFRGFNLYDGIAIQPSLGTSYDLGDAGTLGANVWAHLSGEGDRQAEKFTEVDYTLSYDISLGIASIGLGHVWYTFPDSDDGIDDSAEFFASISFDTLLSPSFSFYHDYDAFDAQYYELGLSHTLECSYLGEGFNITPFVNFGFASNAEKVYADSGGLVQITYGAYFDLDLGDIAVTPSINYTNESDDAASNEFWVGLAFDYSL